MTPYEIMLSESQERMLLVVKRGREAEVERIFDKWDLHAVHIGDVTDDGMLRVKNRGRGGRRDPESRADRRSAGVSAADGDAELSGRRARSISMRSGGPAMLALGRALIALLGSPNVASKRWAYRQYDHMVHTNTVNLPGAGRRRRPHQGHRPRAGDVGRRQRPLLLPRSVPRARCWRWPKAARNVACAGGEPIGATNCLNFGNPERPEIMWQFAQAVEGIGEACRALDVPITGGNVSLYNETDGKAIYPTPVIGVVGLLEHADRVLARVSASRVTRSSCSAKIAASWAAASTSSACTGLVRGVPPVLDLGVSARCRISSSGWRQTA